MAALRALTVLLVACLGDAAVEPALHGTAVATGSDSAAAAGQDAEMAEMADASLAPCGSTALQQALAQLHALEERAKGGAAAPSPAPAPMQSRPPFPQQPGDMRVERTADWVQESVDRLHQLLSTALPPLLVHQRPGVRAALVQGGLVGCRALLGSPMLLSPRLLL